MQTNPYRRQSDQGVQGAFPMPSPINDALADHANPDFEPLGIHPFSSVDDASSVVQPGLEPFDTVERLWGCHSAPINNTNHFFSPLTMANSMHARSEGIRSTSNSSTLTDTDLRVRALEFQINDRCPEFAKESKLERPSVIPRYTSVVESQECHSLLVKWKRMDPEFRDPNSSLFKSKKAKAKAADTKTWTFRNEVKCKALLEAIRSYPIGVVDELLGMRTSITSPLIEQSGGKIRRRETVTEPPNLLLTAISRGDVDILRLIASHGALPQHVTQALLSSVERNLPPFVKVLLQFGADPNALGAVILKSAVELQSVRIVRLLLRAQVSLDGETLADALGLAVTRESLEIISLLILYGADVDFEHGNALRKAVRDQRIEVVLILLKGKPSADTVSAVFNDVFSATSKRSVEEQQLFIKVLLDAGARGTNLDLVLLQVVREGHQSMAALLIKHGASPAYEQGEALRTSVLAKNIPMLKTLMSGYIDEDLATSIFSHVPRGYQRPEVYVMMSLLISKGAKGVPLDLALVAAVQQRNRRVMKLLLESNASADYNNAQALCEAVTSGEIDILQLLLFRGRPRPTSMQIILPLIPAIPPKERYDMTKLIVDASSPAGIPTNVTGDALIKAVESPSDATDLDLVQLIISAGADVNSSHGKCLQLAVQSENLPLLEILCRNKPSRSSASLALTASMSLSSQPLRRKIVKLLLTGEVDGATVANAVVNALKEHPVEDDLISLLLPKADFTDQGSQVLSLAVREASTSITSTIIQSLSGRREVFDGVLRGILDTTLAERCAKLDLMLQAGVSQNTLDQILLGEINGSVCDIRVIKSLLAYHASCNYEDGMALKTAVERQRLDVCEVLINSGPDKEILADTLLQVIETTHGDLKAKLASLLLREGARGIQLSDALRQEICHCATTPDMSAVKLLVQFGARVDIYDTVAIRTTISAHRDPSLLRELMAAQGADAILDSLVPVAMTQDPTWQLIVMEILVANGVVGPCVDDLLIWAISAGDAAGPMLELLLKKAKSLNVNHKNGSCIVKAVRRVSTDVLDDLLQRNPGVLSLRNGIQAILQSKNEESSLTSMAQRIFQHCFQHRLVLFDNEQFCHDSLYQCLHQHADKPGLLQCLLDNGCPPDQRYEWEVEAQFGPEPVFPLLWLVCQAEERTVTSSRTIAILAHHDDVDAAAPRSETTPLMMAARSSQPMTVRELLQAGASPILEDAKRNTALYLATRRNDLEIMRLLLMGGADPDDESLHIAATNLQSDAITLLLENSASVDLPGFRHCGGRTPLNELCLNIKAPVDKVKLKACLRILLGAQKELRRPFITRSSLFLAVDNVPVARDLIPVLMAVNTSLCDEVNSEINIHRMVNGNSERCYSLTMYVRHFLCENSPSQRGPTYQTSMRTATYNPDPRNTCCGSPTCPAPSLEQLLRHYGCKDRYWDDRAGADQPPGTCDPPSHIVEAQNEAREKAKRQAEQAREEAKRQAEQAREEATRQAEQAREEAKRQADQARRLKEEADLRDVKIAAKKAEEDQERRLTAMRKDAMKHETAERLRLRLKEEEEEDRIYRKQRLREREAEDERDARERQRQADQAQAQRERANIHQQELKAELKVIEAREKLMQKAQLTFREFQNASASTGGGRILHEITGG